MSKMLNKSLTTFDYTDETLFVLSTSNVGTFLSSIFTAAEAPNGIKIPSIRSELPRNKIFTYILKIMRKKKNKHKRKNVSLAKSKVNSTEKQHQQMLSRS